jgi:hypothetical protein
MWSNLPNNPRRGLQVVGLFILTLGMGALALPSLGRMGARGVSIQDLETMRTSTKAAKTVAQLGPGGIDAAQTSIYLDFPMLVLYALALSALCVVVAARAAERGRSGLAGAGRTIAWLAPVAAALDAVENVALLQVLDGHIDQPWPGIAFGFAAVKFALLAVVIVYLVIGLLSLGRKVPTQESPAAPAE